MAKQNWAWFSNWEHSDGNRWVPQRVKKIRKAWKQKTGGPVRQMIPAPTGRLAVYCHPKTVFMVTEHGEELWRTDVFAGARGFYDSWPFVQNGAWLYEECLLVEIGGELPAQLDPADGKVVRRSRGDVPESMSTCTTLSLAHGHWYSVGLVTRDGRVPERSYEHWHLWGLGWVGSDCGGEFYERDQPTPTPARCDWHIETICGEWFVLCGGGYPDQRVCVVKGRERSDFANRIEIPEAVDCVICRDAGILITAKLSKKEGYAEVQWLEARRLDQPEIILWKSQPCSFFPWLLGTGDQIWCTERILGGMFEGPGSTRTICRDVTTGEIVRTIPGGHSYGGVICGNHLITASPGMLTGWEITAE